MSTAPRWTVEGRDWPNRGHSRFIEIGRLCWHVQVLGSSNPHAPAMLLLHGTGAATHSWRRLAPLLADNFVVVAPDLPGHGFTKGTLRDGLSMRSMASALGELLIELDLAPQAIVGHSAGAAIAIRMALDGIAKPKAIVGIGAALMPFAGLSAIVFPALARTLFFNPVLPHVFSRVARARGETARFLFRSTGSRIDQEGIASYEKLLATSGHCASAMRMMASWDLDTLKQDLPSLRAPLLLVHGEGDTAVSPSSARAAARLVPGAKLAMLAGLGHLAHEEQPAEMAEIIRDFVGAH